MSERIVIENARVQIRQGTTMEKLIGQLQFPADRFPYVVNGSEVRWYDSLEKAPRGSCQLESDRSERSGEIYLRNTRTEDQICCFSAKLRDVLTGKSSPFVNMVEPDRPASPVEIQRIQLTDLRPARYNDDA